MKKLRNIVITGGILSLIIVCYVSTVNAYQLLGYKWPQPSTTFYVDIPGENDLWNNAFETAMYEWSTVSVFEYYIVRTYSDPCNSNDSRNGVRFESTFCGDAWGGTTLAITNTWYIGSEITQTDIVFNNNESWSVYSTLWSSPPWMGVNDFQRVAVHELGHALGLGHEDRISSTIMGTYAGDNTIPLADDINGVTSIYGAEPCTFSISPSYGIFTSSGGSDSVTVTASSSICAWATSENLYWMNLSPTSGTGNRTVAVTVSSNTGTARNTSITIAGEIYTINQAAVVLQNWYRDSDLDGYGDPDSPLESLLQPGGYVLNNTDCVDYDSSIHSGATEICGDGIDQDCDGIIDELCNNISGSALYRFWSNQNGTHFYTISEGERDFIIANYPEEVWQYEAIAYYAYAPGDESFSSRPVYRFWSDQNQAHFYTISEEEKNYIIANYPEQVWRYETIAYYAYAPGEDPPDSKPVYRFWSDTGFTHFYTISEEEKDYIIANYPEDVWRYETIAWYAYENQ